MLFGVIPSFYLCTLAFLGALFPPSPVAGASVAKKGVVPPPPPRGSTPRAAPPPPPSPFTPTNRPLKDIGRVSDPHIWHEIHNWDVPLSNVTLPPGIPDTIENDIPGSPLSPDDFQRGQVMVFDPIDTSKELDPIEFAGLYEGDIDIQHMHSIDLPIKDFPPAMHDFKEPKTKDPIARKDDQMWNEIVPRSAVTDTKRRWLNGVVPYVVSSKYNEQERAAIAKAMTQFHENTCINFVPRIAEEDYIHIVKGDGCSSSVGKIGGGQQVSLGLGCVNLGIVMHEFMHAIGFWHEQSRFDREDYIVIIWPNIQNGMKYNFQMYDNKVIENLGSYDTDSVMHYGPYAFAKNRKKPTIISMSGGEIGQRRGFSKMDLFKVRELYNCGESGSFVGKKTFSLTNTTTTDASEESACADSHKLCAEWAQKGECDKNALWMGMFCKVSCQQCGSACRDHSPFCEYWSKRDECQKNPNYMHHFCAMSCGLCHSQAPAADGAGGGCVDANAYCEAWSASGQCHINPRYMLKSCRKACAVC